MGFSIHTFRCYYGVEVVKMVKNLKYLRTRYGISQQQLAEIAGVSQQSVNKYENHNIEPDIRTLTAFADFFPHLCGFSHWAHRGRTPD